MILPSPVGELSYALDLADVAANALLGGVKARQHHFDVIGFVTLATVCGLGGGIIRDTLLRRGTLIALADPSYLAVAIGGALVVYLVRIEGRLWEHGYHLVDAAALGFWATAGADRTLAARLG